MGATCLRCLGPVAAPVGDALCSDCHARLHTLLSARAAPLRPQAQTGSRLPVTLLAIAAVSFLIVALWQASLAKEAPLAARGVWRILGGASFLSPVGLVVNRQGDLYVADAA